MDLGGLRFFLFVLLFWFGFCFMLVACGLLGWCLIGGLIWGVDWFGLRFDFGLLCYCFGLLAWVFGGVCLL